jgi:hypothetical protein
MTSFKILKLIEIVAGGPGVSGIEFVLGSGPSYAKAWGYNPVGFDPRVAIIPPPSVEGASSMLWVT